MVSQGRFLAELWKASRCGAGGYRSLFPGLVRGHTQRQFSPFVMDLLSGTFRVRRMVPPWSCRGLSGLFSASPTIRRSTAPDSGGDMVRAFADAPEFLCLLGFHDLVACRSDTDDVVFRSDRGGNHKRNQASAARRTGAGGALRPRV